MLPRTPGLTVAGITAPSSQSESQDTGLYVSSADKRRNGHENAISNVIQCIGSSCIMLYLYLTDMRSNSELISTFSITVMSEQVSKNGIGKLMVSRILQTCHYVCK